MVSLLLASSFAGEVSKDTLAPPSAIKALNESRLRKERFKAMIQASLAELPEDFPLRQNNRSTAGDIEELAEYLADYYSEGGEIPAIHWVVPGQPMSTKMMWERLRKGQILLYGGPFEEGQEFFYRMARAAGTLTPDERMALDRIHGAFCVGAPRSVEFTGSILRQGPVAGFKFAEVLFYWRAAIAGKEYSFEHARPADAGEIAQINNTAAEGSPEIQLNEDQVRDWIVQNPRSLIARDENGRIAGCEFLSLLNSRKVPVTFKSMTQSHAAARQRGRDTLVDFWMVLPDGPEAYDIQRGLFAAAERMADWGGGVSYIIEYRRLACLERILLEYEFDERCKTQGVGATKLTMETFCTNLAIQIFKSGSTPQNEAYVKKLRPMIFEIKRLDAKSLTGPTMVNVLKQSYVEMMKINRRFSLGQNQKLESSVLGWKGLSIDDFIKGHYLFLTRPEPVAMDPVSKRAITHDDYLALMKKGLLRGYPGLDRSLESCKVFTAGCQRSVYVDYSRDYRKAHPGETLSVDDFCRQMGRVPGDRGLMGLLGDVEGQAVFSGEEKDDVESLGRVYVLFRRGNLTDLLARIRKQQEDQQKSKRSPAGATAAKSVGPTVQDRFKSAVDGYVLDPSHRVEFDIHGSNPLGVLLREAQSRAGIVPVVVRSGNQPVENPNGSAGMLHHDKSFDLGNGIEAPTQLVYDENTETLYLAIPENLYRSADAVDVRSAETGIVHDMVEGQELRRLRYFEDSAWMDLGLDDSNAMDLEDKRQAAHLAGVRAADARVKPRYVLDALDRYETGKRHRILRDLVDDTEAKKRAIEKNPHMDPGLRAFGLALAEQVKERAQTILNRMGPQKTATEVEFRDQFVRAVGKEDVEKILIYPLARTEVEDVLMELATDSSVTDVLLVDPAVSAGKRRLEHVLDIFEHVGNAAVRTYSVEGPLPDWRVILVDCRGKLRRLHVIGAAWENFHVPRDVGIARNLVVHAHLPQLWIGGDFLGFYRGMLAQMRIGDRLCLKRVRSPLVMLAWSVLGLEREDARLSNYPEGEVDAARGGDIVYGWVVLKKQKDVTDDQIDAMIQLDAALSRIRDVACRDVQSPLKDVPGFDEAFGRVDAQLRALPGSQRAQAVKAVRAALDSVVVSDSRRRELSKLMQQSDGFTVPYDPGEELEDGMKKGLAVDAAA